MDTPLELLRNRLATLRFVASQRGFSKNKKEAALMKPLFETAILILETCEGSAVSTSEKDLRVCEVIASAWISVKERLPELKGEFPDRSSDTVLAWIPSGMILAKYLYIDEGDDGKGYVWCQVYDGLDGDAEWDDNYEVSHWCPLPTAPN